MGRTFKMGQQCYIKCDNYYLVSCVYVPEDYSKVVILLQGYSHSMTDIDYFMTNVKNRLVEHKCAVVQFDPYGHGDSDGNIEFFDFKKLIRNLEIVINWAYKQFNCNISLITRGLFELSIYNTNLSNILNKCVVLNPLSLAENEYWEIKKFVPKEDIVDFNDWFISLPNDKKDFFVCLFYSMGAQLKNLQGQYFNTEIFQDFISRMHNRQSFIGENSYYVFSNGIDNYNIKNNCNYPMQYTLNYYYKYAALPRDPEWHFQVINNIVSLCIDI